MYSDDKEIKTWGVAVSKQDVPPAVCRVINMDGIWSLNADRLPHCTSIGLDQSAECPFNHKNPPAVSRVVTLDVHADSYRPCIGTLKSCHSVSCLVRFSRVRYPSPLQVSKRSDLDELQIQARSLPFTLTVASHMTLWKIWTDRGTVYPSPTHVQSFHVTTTRYLLS